MEDEMKTLQPGDKIYSLFAYKEVMIRGKQELFLIRIEKVPDDNKSDDNTFRQHVRAMG